MKILVIAPFVPWPLNQGGSIRMFNIVRELAKYHEITLACLTDENNPDFGALTTCCRSLVGVQRKPSFLRDFAGFLLGGEAYNMRRFSSTPFRDRLGKLAGSEQFDLLLVEYSYLWQYAGLFPGVLKLLDAHNLENSIVRQLGNDCKNPLKRLLYRFEERKLRRSEELAWEEADGCLAVSTFERESIAACVTKPAKVLAIPNGVDLERFAFRGSTGGGKGILLLGWMDYQPNCDAAKHFLADILPLIRTTAPTVPVHVVGRALSRLSDWDGVESVCFHENVPEIHPWLEQCDLLVVPLRFGAGTRIKILEAMAAGIPVVATAKGCEGIEVIAGEHLLVAESPERFAAAVVHLLNDRQESLRLAGNARCFIEERYSWTKIVLTLANYLEESA